VNELLVFALLFAAIAIGWWLGRRGATATVSGPELPRQYYRGLNYILEDQPDGAIDAFINALEVNSETLETHIALGNLLRKRGEVDRAIRIHQNLLARPSLPRSQMHVAHLELARDYISAGLLDRAERLLLDLVDESPQQRRASRRYLLEIYQSEREWSRAIEVARELLPRKSLLGSGEAQPGEERGQPIAVVISHLYCELASDKIAAGEVQSARQVLHEALSHDRNCVRASLMLGELEYNNGNYQKAVKALRNVRQQDPDFVPETIACLARSYRELGDERTLKSYLQESLQATPSTSLVLALAEHILETEGADAAEEFLSAQLAERPSMRGLSRLISLQIDDSEGKAREDLGLLQVLVNRLMSERPVYRCTHCGFSGRHLHWHCPGCKDWGTIKTIRGATGE
jgi:lipopolysaccharide biosynthesis regulator YciM